MTRRCARREIGYQKLDVRIAGKKRATRHLRTTILVSILITIGRTNSYRVLWKRNVAGRVLINVPNGSFFAREACLTKEHHSHSAPTELTQTHRRIQSKMRLHILLRQLLVGHFVGFAPSTALHSELGHFRHSSKWFHIHVTPLDTTLTSRRASRHLMPGISWYHHVTLSYQVTLLGDTTRFDSIRWHHELRDVMTSRDTVTSRGIQASRDITSSRDAMTARRNINVRLLIMETKHSLQQQQQSKECRGKAWRTLKLCF